MESIDVYTIDVDVNGEALVVMRKEIFIRLLTVLEEWGFNVNKFDVADNRDHG